MFGLTKKTRSELMRAELGESWEHFLQAASHAANGVGSSIGPSASKMRGLASRSWESTASTLAPLASAYREGAADGLKLADKKAKKRQKEKQMSKKRTGLLIGLLAAGAAIGAAGALVMRRRKKQQWSEYDPSSALDSMSPDARSMLDKATAKADSAIDKAAQHANKARDLAADKLESTASSVRSSDLKGKIEESAATAAEKTDDFTSRYSSAKHNGR